MSAKKDSNDHLCQIVVLVSSLLIISFLNACNESFPIRTESFYYPLNELNEGLVYHYQTKTNDQPQVSSYWYFKTNNINDTLYLSGQYYDGLKSVRQLFIQKCLTNIAELQDYTLFLPSDTNGQVLPVRVDVQYSNAFPFLIKDTLSVYLYKLSFISPVDSAINTITRNRRFLKKEEWSFNGKVYPAIKIRLLERIENDIDGVLTIDLKGYEIYAKGIGLVYSLREGEDGTRIEERLVDRMLMDDFL